MKNIIFFFLTVGIFLCYAANADAYQIDIKINKQKAETGIPVTATVRIAGPDIKKVSWQLFDDLLTGTHKVEILKTTSSVTGDKVYEHQVIFTAANPCDTTIGGLPVVITLASGQVIAALAELHFNFIQGIAPSAIGDIKPQAGSNWRQLIMKPLLVILLVSVVAISLYLILYKKADIVSRKKRLPVRELCYNSLQKIELLETEMQNGRLAGADVWQRLYLIISNFFDDMALKPGPGRETYHGLEQELPQGADTGISIMNDILKIARQNRFSGMAETKDSPEKYLADLKVAIQNQC